jgi:hypothetical protein
LPVGFYGCETWSLTFREELSVRVFVNRVLRLIFGPKRDEVNSSPNIIRLIKPRRKGWSVLIMYERRGAYRVLVGKTKGK